MWQIVVCERERGKEQGPVIPIGIYVGPEGRLQILIHNLCLPICLWVIGSSESSFHLHLFARLLPKGTGPSRVSLSDIICLGTPNLEIMCSKNSLAVPSSLTML
jgi:hypothetical protein